MNPKAIPKTIEKQQWLDPAAQTLQKGVERVYGALGPAGDKAKEIMHGDWLGHPLHPAITDIPIGSLSAAVALDTIDAVRGTEKLSAGADTAIAIGIGSGLVAASTGWTDWHMMRDQGIKRTGLIHAGLNVTGIALFSLSLLERRKKRRKRGRFLALLGYGLLVAGAFLGGSMVYDQGAGVGDV